MAGNKENKQAAEFRREAKVCIEMAERMSMRVDRELLIDMAKHWLELAERAEKEERGE
jgi:hypothetical protein